MTMKFFKNKMTTEFLWNSSLIWREFFKKKDDHGIIMNIFNDFDQNSGSQPYYPTIQMTIEFFKN
jgi:hypothetical protein